MKEIICRMVPHQTVLKDDLEFYEELWLSDRYF